MMPAIEWTDSLELGLASMDDTHREFVERYNELASATTEDFLTAYDRFLAHTVEHFEQENRWMEAVGFPGCHKAEHDRVLEVIRDVRERVVRGDGFLGLRLIEELPGWFENHAGGMDAALAHYLKTVEFDFTTCTPSAQKVEAGVGGGCGGPLASPVAQGNAVQVQA